MRMCKFFTLVVAIALPAAIASAEAPLTRWEAESAGWVTSREGYSRMPGARWPGIRGRVAQFCQQYGEGCGSCVADGLWGALWHTSDCRVECHKICGTDPAR